MKGDDFVNVFEKVKEKHCLDASVITMLVAGVAGQSAAITIDASDPQSVRGGITRSWQQLQCEPPRQHFPPRIM